MCGKGRQQKVLGNISTASKITKTSVGNRKLRRTMAQSVTGQIQLYMAQSVTRQIQLYVTQSVTRQIQLYMAQSVTLPIRTYHG